MGEARRGRPSVADERRRQIVDAFIGLIAAHGLDRVGLDDVAAAAGVKRSALRHFIGNRDALVTATVHELRRRYEATIRGIVPESAGADQLIRALFSDDWVQGFEDEDVVFDALLHEATRSVDGPGEVRQAYDLLIAELEAALHRDHPAAPLIDVRNAAYSITCLIEHNTTMQRLGYPRARSAGALATALRIAHDIGRPR